MQELQRFRGTERRSGQELRSVMRTLLRADATTRSRGEAVVYEAVDALLGEGIPFTPEFSAYSGYAQVVGLYAGTLLKLAGASLAAIRAELLRRDEAALEALVPVLQHRLRPNESLEDFAPANEMPAPGAPTRSAVTSAVEISIPTPRDAPPPVVQSAAVSAVGAQAGGPHDYLRGLITEDIGKLIRAWRGATARPATVAVPAGPALAAAEIDACLRIELADGIALELRGSQMAALGDRGRRAEVLRQLAAQLDRFYGG